MAIASSWEASTSSSEFCYHVFLSFRGSDTGTGFSDLLLAALEQAGFRTFIDDDGIEQGEIIDVEIQRAMQDSKLFLVVFSNDYASSTWCLDKLVKIMELRESAKKIVVPVFYDVDPSDVWDQSGSFAEAFLRHEELFKDMVGKWRQALRDVSELGGMVSQDGYEAKFIKKIIKMVCNKFKNLPQHTPLYLVGMDSRVKDINQWLQDASNEVSIATVYGIGGIGKTIIAETVYNQNMEKFERSCFLANVRETLKQPDGQLFLQKQLLQKTVEGKMRKIKSVDEGLVEIEHAINCRRVLIVFDDVDQSDHLTIIIGSWDWLFPGSKVIITTRHKNLLKVSERHKKFHVKELDITESLELFSWYAFGRNHPFEGYMELSKHVVDYCCGVPVALQVLGSYLSEFNEYEWENALEKLRVIPHSKVQKTLKVSYDSLQDDREQNLFLHIACFFIGKDKDDVVKILEGCGFSAKAGIQNLEDRHLVSVNEANKVMMHPLIRDMGREIVRQESPEDPGKRSRLWNLKDALTVLREKTGTEAIKGLILNQYTGKKDKQSTTSDMRISKGQYHQHLNYNYMPNQYCLGHFSCQPADVSLTSSFDILNEKALETKAFAKMHQLKLLNLNDVRIRINGGYECFPKHLVWLSWHGFPMKSIPSNLCLEKLVVLDMCNSSLKNIWNRTRVLLKLKILNLSHSHDLVRTPDFSGLPNLEQLKLKDCINLVEVHESIGDLERLVTLNLKYCRSLRKLPIKIFMSKSLEKLILSGCLKLNGLPQELKSMASLRLLHADGLNMRESKSTATSWLSTLSSCLATRSVSFSFSLSLLPHCITHLSLAHSNLSDDDILDNLGCLTSLRHLNLSGNSIGLLPEGIKGLTMLGCILLDQCSRLKSLPELPTTLKELSAKNCTSLEKITNLPNLFRTLKLQLVGCEQLVEVQGLFKLEPINNHNIDMVSNSNLICMESVQSTEVHMFNCMTMTSRKFLHQVLHECGISSIFLPMSEVPSWCNTQNEGHSLHLELPLFPVQRISGLVLCIIYTRVDQENVFDPHQYIKISSNKGMKWTYSPTFLAVPEMNKDMLWLSHWSLEDKLDVGDEVKILVAMSLGYKVQKCGVYVVCKQEGQDADLNCEEIMPTGPPFQQTLKDVDKQVYRVGDVDFFLCNHDFSTHQRISECDENKSKLYSLIF